MKWTRRDIANLIRALELAIEFDQAISNSDSLTIPMRDWPEEDRNRELDRRAEVGRFKALRKRLLKLEGISER